MYSLETISNEKDELKNAVLNARPFKPLYVKIKVFYGCNLKCEMCSQLMPATKSWRMLQMPRTLA